MVAKSLRTVSQLAEELPAFDQAAIRRLIFQAEENGLAPAIVRIGRRVLLDVDLFNTWVESQRMAPANSATVRRPRHRQRPSQRLY